MNAKAGAIPAGVGFVLALGLGLLSGGWGWALAALLMLANGFVVAVSLASSVTGQQLEPLGTTNRT